MRGKAGVTPYILEFSDRYSVYGWGEMPDHLQGKGVALGFMAWFFFDFLGRSDNWRGFDVPAALAAGDVYKRACLQGLPHHMIGLAGGDLKPLSLDREILSPSKLLLVRALRMPETTTTVRDENFAIDYAVYKARPADVLMPLEIVFSLPAGAEMPALSYFTKYEDERREITDAAQAQELCGLNDAEFSQMTQAAQLVALRLRDCLKGIGLDLAGGRLQFAAGLETAGVRSMMLADAIGPDELTIQASGIRLSKEVLQGNYRGTTWLAAVEKSKAIAAERGEKDWKKICAEEFKAQPPLLSPIVKERAGMIYQSLSRALCEKYLGKPIFAKSWDMQKLVSGFEARNKAA